MSQHQIQLVANEIDKLTCRWLALELAVECVGEDSVSIEYLKEMASEMKSEKARKENELRQLRDKAERGVNY